MVLAVAAFWIALGLLGLASKGSREAHARVVFPLGALGGVVLAATAFFGLVGGPQTLVLPLGLPDLPFHLRLDPLSAFFLLLLGAASTGVSLHAAGYFQTGGGGEIRLICLQYHVFLAAMVMVLLADDAYAFMVAWELMALASYFLVTTDHATRRSAARACCTWWSRTSARWRSCCASACSSSAPGTTRSPRCARTLCRRVGPGSPSCSRCSASARKPGSCPCTCGCPKRTRRRPRRCRR